MKRIGLITFIIGVFLLAGCTEEKETAKDTGSLVEENALTSQIHTLEEQVDNLIEQRNKLEKGKKLFTTFSYLTFDFMKALQTGDLDLLESVVSNDFNVEVTKDSWFYITNEPIDGNNKILFYDANNQIKFWRINFYGQVPDYEKYGMSIRIFTEENIKSGMAEVINLSFEEIDGEWKIVYMDPYV
ncbi:hypothetical protein NSQ62_09330 [Solibacillus sp. FSL H8-0523]|uniref:hypothetical protein n=1 Tax=Solibacillus sp. FSL H8-0523 TaxID=2954511 RepID=UPI003100C0D7